MHRSRIRAILRRIAERFACGAREEVAGQQFADIGARHDHPFVDMEGDAADIGAAEEIGRRLARRDACLDQIGEALALGQDEPGVEERIELVDRKLQGLEHDEGRLVEGIGRAVAIDEAGSVETADREAEEVADRDEFRHGRSGEGAWGRHDFS